MIAAVVLVGIPLMAQETEPAESESRVFAEAVDVEVINVEVFVTDKSGVPVTGLQKEDFTLFVDGQEIAVPYFYVSSDRRHGTTPDVVASDPAGSSPPDLSLIPAVPPDQRLHLAVVVDNTHIKAANRKRAFAELRSFLQTRLADGALVTVASLNPELIIHSDLVSDPGAVSAVLDQIQLASDRPRFHEIERRQLLGELSTTGRIYNRRDYSETNVSTSDTGLIARTRAYAESEFARSQATLRTLAQLVASLAGVPGRKALLYVSDGLPNRPGEEIFEAWSYRFGDRDPAPQGLRSAGSDTDYSREIGRFDLMPQVDQLAELASSSRVTWYAIDAEPDHSGTLRSAALAGGIATEALDALEANVREPAERTAEITGGRRIQASSHLGLDLARIGDFDSYYSLGFSPGAAGSDGTAASGNIRVEVRGGKGLVVRHRENYQLRSNDDRMAESTLATLLFQRTDNPLEIAAQLGSVQERDDGAFVLPVEIAIPLRNLVLVPLGNDTHGTQLSVYVTVKDGTGLPRPVQKLPFTASIPADRLEEALENSARYTLPLVVQKGDQQIAISVRDELGSAESSLRIDIDPLL